MWEQEEMEIRVIRPEQMETSIWSGGTTTQLGIGEGECSYGDRNFLWRLSSATVEDETSHFTSLPDYDRLILMQEGTVLLSHDEKPEIKLEPWQVHCFDGGACTVCRGRATDFNLMVRKGAARGSLRVLEQEETFLLSGESQKEKKWIYALYNGGDDLEVKTKHGIFPVNAGGIMYLSGTGSRNCPVTVLKTGNRKTGMRTILAKISFDINKNH